MFISIINKCQSKSMIMISHKVSKILLNPLRPDVIIFVNARMEEKKIYIVITIDLYASLKLYIARTYASLNA